MPQGRSGTYIVRFSKAAAQRVFAKYMRTNDPQVLETSYANYVKTIPRKPGFTPKGIQFMLDMLAPQMPQAKTAKVAQFMEPSLVNELEKEGFFVEMAKRYPERWPHRLPKTPTDASIQHERILPNGFNLPSHRPELSRRAPQSFSAVRYFLRLSRRSTRPPIACAASSSSEIFSARQEK